jgi:hypothetical protein
MQLRKKHNYAFKHTGNVDKIVMHFDVLEITLSMIKVQRKSKLEAQVMKIIV